jgi:hypothetical protein
MTKDTSKPVSGKDILLELNQQAEKTTSQDRRFFKGGVCFGIIVFLFGLSAVYNGLESHVTNGIALLWCVSGLLLVPIYGFMLWPTWRKAILSLFRVPLDAHPALPEGGAK